MKIQELYTDESRWCRANYAQRDDGFPVMSLSPDAVCWCLAGAICYCYAKEEFGAKTSRADTIRAKVNLALGGHESHGSPSNDSDIVRWNDEPGRRFEDVVALVRALDI